MATPKPTQKPVPSSDIRDLPFNSEKMDEFTNSESYTYVDRLGKNRRTLAGIDQDANRAMSSYGYITKDSFEAGNTLDTPNVVLRWRFNGEFYRWDGDWSGPKVISAGSTPMSTGGTITPEKPTGAWTSVGDATFRTDIKKGDGTLIGVDGEAANLSDFYSSYNAVKVKSGDTVSRIFHNTSLRIIASGGDFSRPQLFPVVPKERTINPAPPEGVISNLNLTVKPYSVDIGGVGYWLLDNDSFSPSAPSLEAFWAKSGENAPYCDESISALLGSFSRCVISAGIFRHRKTIAIPQFTTFTGSGGTNAIEYPDYFRTTQFWYDPEQANENEPAMVLAETGKQAYSVTLADFSIRAIGFAVNKSKAIVRRTKASSVSNDFLSRFSAQRLALYDFNDGLILDHAWLVDMSNIVVKARINAAATGVGIQIKQGTSINVRSCFVLGGGQGYRIFGTYSALYNCGSDQQSKRAYTLGAGVLAESCGAESPLSGAVVFTGSSRWKDYPDSSLGSNPARINSPFGLLSVSSVTIFSDEEDGIGGSMIVEGGGFTVGDSVIPVRCNGNSEYSSSIKLNLVKQSVSIAEGFTGRRDLSFLRKNVSLGANARNVILSFNDDADVLSRQTSGGLGAAESFLCMKVPRGQEISLQTSLKPFDDQSNIAKLTSDICFTSSNDGAVMQRHALKASDRIQISYHTSPTDDSSIFVLFTFRDIANGRSVMVRMTTGSGYGVDPTIATSGVRITPIVMS